MMLSSGRKEIEISVWDRINELQAMCHRAEHQRKPSSTLVLQLIRCCNEGAIEVLYNGKAPWSQPYLHQPPPRLAAASASKMVKLAEIALESPLLQAGACSTEGAAEDIFSRHWPAVLTSGSQAVIQFVCGKPRLALGYSNRCIELLYECCTSTGHPPDDLVSIAFDATHSRGVAEKVVSQITTHASILHALEKNEEALPFAQLAVSLAKSTHDQLQLFAAQQFCYFEENTNQRFSPLILMHRSSVSLLQAIASFNAAIISEKLRLDPPIIERLFHHALINAEADLGPKQPFVNTIIRERDAFQKKRQSEIRHQEFLAAAQQGSDNFSTHAKHNIAGIHRSKGKQKRSTSPYSLNLHRPRPPSPQQPGARSASQAVSPSLTVFRKEVGGLNNTLMQLNQYHGKLKCNRIRSRGISSRPFTANKKGPKLAQTSGMWRESWLSDIGL